MNPRNERAANPVRDSHRRRKERGNVLVEFVLCFLLFFLVTLVGVMDLGRAIWAHNVLAHASREAARYAIVRGADSLSPATASDITTYLHSRLPFLGSDSVTVSVTWDPIDKSPGGTVEIQATYTFEPLIGTFVPSIPLSSTAQMVVTN